eukprot:COSAG06_NODE_24833_length_651_cov_1.213768_1_plen_40_part_10
MLKLVHAVASCTLLAAEVGLDPVHCTYVHCAWKELMQWCR